MNIILTICRTHTKHRKDCETALWSKNGFMECQSFLFWLVLVGFGCFGCFGCFGWFWLVLIGLGWFRFVLVSYGLFQFVLVGLD